MPLFQIFHYLVLSWTFDLDFKYFKNQGKPTILMGTYGQVSLFLFKDIVINTYQISLRFILKEAKFLGLVKF